MGAAGSPQAVQSAHHTNEKGRLAQAETSMVQRQRSSVLEANNAKSEAENGFGDYCFIMRSTMNEGLLKGKLEGGDEERARL